MTATTTAAEYRTDEQIQHDVLAELRWDARLQPNEIGVIVKNGIVALTGWVDSYIKRWAAEEAAHRVRGVKAVVNDIEVRLPISAERNDADLAEAAVRALEWDAAIPTENIEVTVSKGWVTLKGEVDWQYQKEDAEQAIRRLLGVRGLTNLITVRSRPASRTLKDDLKKRIEDALVRSAQLDAQHIVVEVTDGKVTLDGKVRSWTERQEAERAVWSAPGVTSVENNIGVVPL